MMSKKQLLAGVMSRTGAAAVARGLAPANRLLILAYHRVVDYAHEAVHGGDLDLISASCADFRWQMTHLKNHYNVVSFKDLRDAEQGLRRLPPRPVIVTFDDGFVDNHDNALEILEDVGVTATFFVSSGYLDQHETFWFSRVATLLHHLPQGSHRVDHWPVALDGCRNGTTADPARVEPLIEEALSALKSLTNGDRVKAVCALGRFLAERTDEPIPDPHLAGPMTRQQVRNLHVRGMEIGSHTVTHPILTSLEDDQLVWEIKQSKADLAAITGVSCDVLSYPDGGSNAYDESVIELLRDVGYHYACSYISGVNFMDRLEGFALKRLHVERYTTRADFEMLLAMPGIFG